MTAKQVWGYTDDLFKSHLAFPSAPWLYSIQRQRCLFITELLLRITQNWSSRSGRRRVKINGSSLSGKESLYLKTTYSDEIVLYGKIVDLIELYIS